MVSVIIVNYLCAHLTANAVESIYHDDPDAQVIVVDNSTDPCEADLLRDLLPSKAELIVSETNGGFGYGCNLGYSHAMGDYVLLLNPDTRIIKGCLKTLSEALDADRNLDAVSPAAYWDDTLDYHLPAGELQSPLSELLIGCAYRSAFFGRVFSKNYRKRALSLSLSNLPQPQNMLSGAHMMIRKSAIDAMEYFFDERFFLYYEDTDLNLRLLHSGGKLSLVPEAKVVHYWKSDPSKWEHTPRSRELYMEKHFKRSFWWSIKAWCDRKPLYPQKGFTDLGTLDSNITFPIPDGKNRVLEISLNHLFVPSAIYLIPDSVHEASLPSEIVQLLGKGDYWGRIGDLKDIRQVYKWTIAS